MSGVCVGQLPGSKRTHGSQGLRLGLAALLVGIGLSWSLPAWAGQSPLPPGVPDIFNRSIRSQFEPVAVVNLRGNPDLPVVVVRHKQEDGQPQVLLLALDARNGRHSWSLATDPIILIVVFASPSTILSIHTDSGFLERGQASGTYVTKDHPDSLILPDVLRAVAAVANRAFL
jgi:hypothetical protein